VIRHEPGKLLLSGGQKLDVGLAIAMTRLSGPAISGLPRDADGYIPVDVNGGVVGVEDVYAAGDATTYPVKQGGLATQQADAIAALIATRLGADVESSPRGLLLRAVLFGGREKRYLRAQLGDQLEASSQASSSPLWPDSNKLIGRYLTPYLDSLDELSAVAGAARSEADP
jgi:sulfide:quinone oxidoreductase